MTQYNEKKDQTSSFDHLDYVIVSSIDWSEIWQMPQQLATSLVDSGHRVLFIENTGVRSPRLGDFSRIAQRIGSWLKSTKGFYDVRDNLTVFSPLFLPLPYSSFALAINQFMLSGSIGNWMRSYRFNNPVVITFLPTPLIDSIIKSIDPIMTIYYCANDMPGGSSSANQLRPYEDKFFAKVDAVLCNSNALMDKAKQFTNKTYLCPAGVNFDMFEEARMSCEVPVDLLAIVKPVVGYVGAISTVFDQHLLVYAAKMLPNVNFVLIGPVYTNITLLETCQNIKIFGKRPYHEMPAYIKGFDVALIPYIKNAFTDAVYSCKLNEYLAMGSLVVATDLRELRMYVQQYGNVLEIAKTKEDFVEKIFSALFKSIDANKSARINAARLNSWDERFKGICGVVNNILIEKNSIKSNWRSRFTKQYLSNRIRIFKIFLAVIFLYMLIFQSPLVWFAGDYLSLKQEPKQADAIVIFSGDGESSYINQSYQRRTIDGIRYFKLGYAPLIILSSGRDQTFSEVSIIRQLLINNGVPEHSIKVQEKYPSSTFENVSDVKILLSEQKVKSVLFITSPYHSRRSLLVWKKVMPNLVVTVPAVVDTPKTTPQWRASTDQIKVICYEYAAIVYYWWKGYLG
jgi:uncharacterized SAM-binding protein YcdF (DUF218 family)/glycosyltransferase involved in cell wall biosynthesis